MKNVVLLERHLAVSAPPAREKRSAIGATILAMIALVLIVAAGFAMSIFVARLLWGLWTR
jgi:hypothetical protein